MWGLKWQWISAKMKVWHPRQLKKIKILGAILELPGKLHFQFSPFSVNGLDWQCCFAGSFKTAPRILISLFAMGADYSFDYPLRPKPPFFGLINSEAVYWGFLAPHPLFCDYFHYWTQSKIVIFWPLILKCLQFCKKLDLVHFKKIRPSSIKPA